MSQDCKKQLNIFENTCGCFYHNQKLSKKNDNGRLAVSQSTLNSLSNDIKSCSTKVNSRFNLNYNVIMGKHFVNHFAQLCKSDKNTATKYSLQMFQTMAKANS